MGYIPSLWLEVLREFEYFHVFRYIPVVEGSLSDNTVTSIHEDSWGILWADTRNCGINRFDLTSGRFSTYPMEVYSDIHLQASQAVRCIYEDHSGRIWIRTNHRVYLYRENEDRFEL